MLKPFYTIGILMLLMMVLISLHDYLYDKKRVTESINAVVDTTRMAYLSLSVSYYEPRLYKINRAHNPSYPEMMPIERMDFVYAR